MELTALMELAIGAALAAGREIMSVYATDFVTDRKADRSPITEADRRAHTAILDQLQDSGLEVISEEDPVASRSLSSTGDHYWLVDPLDGTREFVHRNDQFTVNIALMERLGSGLSKPVGGVLLAPVTDTLYFAWHGGGAYKQDRASVQPGIGLRERMERSNNLPTVPRNGSFTILASRSHRDADTDAFIRSKEQEHGRVLVTGVGSALKFGLMAEGVADAYPRFGPTMEWDTAAGQAICEEAGLQVIALDTGAPLTYDKHDLMNPPFIVQHA